MKRAEPPPKTVSSLWQGIWGTLRKTAVFLTGGTALSIGLVLVLIPGPPGWPLVLGGLALLATEFAWARRLIRGSRSQPDGAKKAPQALPQGGSVSLVTPDE